VRFRQLPNGLTTSTHHTAASAVENVAQIAQFTLFFALQMGNLAQNSMIAWKKNLRQND
jgi:hypothetical protein